MCTFKHSDHSRGDRGSRCTYASHGLLFFGSFPRCFSPCQLNTFFLLCFCCWHERCEILKVFSDEIICGICFPFFDHFVYLCNSKLLRFALDASLCCMFFPSQCNKSVSDRVARVVFSFCVYVLDVHFVMNKLGNGTNCSFAVRHKFYWQAVSRNSFVNVIAEQWSSIDTCILSWYHAESCSCLFERQSSRFWLLVHDSRVGNYKVNFFVSWRHCFGLQV